MLSCFAVNCTTRNSHRLPPETEKLRRKQWLNNIRRDIRGVNLDQVRLCSKHFTEDLFQRDLKAELMGTTPGKRTLKEDAIPTIFDFSKVVLKRPCSEKEQKVR